MGKYSVFFHETDFAPNTKHNKPVVEEWASRRSGCFTVARGSVGLRMDESEMAARQSRSHQMLSFQPLFSAEVKVSCKAL